MKLDYNISAEEKAVLAGCIGKEMKFFLVTGEDCSMSFELFVLHFPDTDVEINTKEVIHVNSWFEETNTIEVVRRPDRNSVSPLAAEEQSGSLVRKKLVEVPVGKILQGVSLAVNTMTWADEDPGSGDYVRGLIFHFKDEDIVFDKGGLNWEEIWSVTRCHPRSYVFKNSDDPEEYPEISTSTRIEEIIPK